MDGSTNEKLEENISDKMEVSSNEPEWFGMMTPEEYDFYYGVWKEPETRVSGWQTEGF